jgi:hypothetical protein
MSHISLFVSAARRGLAVAASCAALMSFPSAADAAIALVRWLPSQDPAVSRYDVYVRNAGSRYATRPAWSGIPTPASDGAMAALVAFTPAASGANWFAVVAVTAEEESPLSRELATGTPNPCRSDSCATKTACDFAAVTDGTACDDDAFCNGAEVCRSGVCSGGAPRDCADTSACTVDACDEAADTCTHVASPGCCAACDGTDPCLADACAAGDCSATPGGDVVIKRMRFTHRADTSKLSLKGTFASAASVDPAASGVILELRTADGALLHASAVAPESFTASPSGRRFHFATRSEEPDPVWNGLEQLDVRRRDDGWLVSAQLRGPELRDVAAESALTLVIRLGDTCVRRLDAACKHSEVRAICR